MITIDIEAASRRIDKYLSISEWIEQYIEKSIKSQNRNQTSLIMLK